ncbi:MAG: galactokinase, partial [Candidatus Sumerlaeota bacterium]|nr:galactokinase [Candidatus Sumerlaeota bacterium]
SQYAYCPVRFERIVPVPGEWIFAIGSSGVAAEKTGEAMAKFNRASRLVSTIVETWRRETRRSESTLGAIVASSPTAIDHLRDRLSRSKEKAFAPGELIERLEHFVVENEDIIPAAGNALARGDVEEFGRLADRSQDATEHLLKNQAPETVFLAHTARELGAGAASAFGAGFGGSVWALVREEMAPDFLNEWEKCYRAAYPAPAARGAFFATPAGPAAFELGL